MTSDRPTTSRWWLFLLVTTVLGALLRAPGLGYSFYGDEVFTLLFESKKFYLDTPDRFRPVFSALLYLWRQLGFEGEVGLRLFPFLLGVAQIPLAYAVGRRLGGMRLGSVLAVLVASSPILIEFSSELRMYSLLPLIALAQVYALLMLLDRPTVLRWLAFVVLGLLGVYTHLFYFLLLAGMALTFLRERRVLPLWKGWSALLTIVLLYLPNLPLMLAYVKTYGSVYALHTPSALPKVLAAMTVGYNYFAFPDQGPERPVSLSDVMRNLPLALLATVAALLMLYALLQLHRREGRSRALWLAHELFSVPILLALAGSVITGNSWLWPKHLIFTSPMLLLLLAQGYLVLEKVWLRRGLAFLALLILLVALVHSWDPVHYGRRENWRGAAEYLRRTLDENSALLVLRGGYTLLPYYWPEARQRWQVIDVPQQPAGSNPAEVLADELRSRLAGKRNIYYLWYDITQNREDPDNILFHTLDRIGTRTDTVQFNPRFKLYTWRLEG